MCFYYWKTALRRLKICHIFDELEHLMISQCRLRLLVYYYSTCNVFFFTLLCYIGRNKKVNILLRIIWKDLFNWSWNLRYFFIKYSCLTPFHISRAQSIVIFTTSSFSMIKLKSDSISENPFALSRKIKIHPPVIMVVRLKISNEIIC